MGGVEALAGVMKRKYLQSAFKVPPPLCSEADIDERPERSFTAE